MDERNLEGIRKEHVKNRKVFRMKIAEVEDIIVKKL